LRELFAKTSVFLSRITHKSNLVSYSVISRDSYSSVHGYPSETRSSRQACNPHLQRICYCRSSMHL